MESRVRDTNPEKDTLASISLSGQGNKGFDSHGVLDSVCQAHEGTPVFLPTAKAPLPHQGLSLCAGSSCAERLGGISPQPMQADVSPSSYQQKTDRSRHIKTNCDDDVKSVDFSIGSFKNFIIKRENWYIRIHGKNKKLDEEFTFNKTDIHRWKDGYLKKRLARLYKLRDWFKEQPSNEVTMVSFTVPHNENKYGKKVNTGHNIFQAWENLKQGWSRIRQCGVFRGKEFVIFYEPHESGYPHLHVMVFHNFTNEERNHLQYLWSEFTGASLVAWERCKARPDESIWEVVDIGADVRPGIGVDYLIAYLIKYMGKTLYHTMATWSRGEWAFNAIAYEKRYRLFGSSNNLAKVMRLVSDKDEDVETTDVNLCGLDARCEEDDVLETRVWTKPAQKVNSPFLSDKQPSLTSDQVARYKKKYEIRDSDAEFLFLAKHEVWLKRGGVDRWRDIRISQRWGQ